MPLLTTESLTQATSNRRVNEDQSMTIGAKTAAAER